MSSPANSAPVPLTSTLRRIADGELLTADESEVLFRAIMSGDVAPEVIGGVLLALRARGESPAEIAGAVRALRAVMKRVSHPTPEQLVDTCGTGGGEVTTINLSTAAAFVAAGAGVPLAKHGNRSFTSRSGSADVLEAMGVGIDTAPGRASEILQTVGLVFLFAPAYHPAMAQVGPVRRALGVPTLMNLVGPLANPAMVQRQVVGVADRDRAPLVAAALATLGTDHSWVVRGEIGLDEISPLGLTRVWEVREGGVQEWVLDPATVGLAAESLEGLEGGEPGENASRLVQLFETPSEASPTLRAAVLLNAAAAVVVSGLAATFPAAVEAAIASLDEGRAAERLALLRAAAPATKTS